MSARRSTPVAPSTDPAVIAARTCACGRLCASRAGRATHGRTCPVERARSRAFVEGIERGLTHEQATEHMRRAVLAAREGRPHPLVPITGSPGRCHCGRIIRAADGTECAEHDDPPAAPPAGPQLSAADRAALADEMRRLRNLRR